MLHDAPETTGNVMLTSLGVETVRFISKGSWAVCQKGVFYLAVWDTTIPKMEGCNTLLV